MSLRQLLFACACLVSIATAAETLPTEIRLTRGVVLRNVKPERFEKTRVILRHAGGVDPVLYANIQDPERTALEAARDRILASAQPAKAEKQSYEGQTFSGEVYIATRGGETKRLAEVSVYAFPMTAWTAFDSYQKVTLPAPVAKTMTDGDGRFTLKVPPNVDVFLLARAQRMVGGRGSTDPYERYVWRVPAADIEAPDKVIFSNRNLSDRPYVIEIGP